MNAITGELALDVAFTKFSGEAPVALVVSYNGPALPTREQAAEWNRPLLLGFESDTTRAYAGGDAGERDSAFSCGVFDSWGYPRDCGSWVCAADTPNTSAQFLPNIEEYAFRYAVRQLTGGRFGPLAGYGNPEAVEAFCRGVRRAGFVGLRWGVGTWRYGETRDGQPPAVCDVEMLQSGNNPGPRPATDLDWLYAQVAVFAPMGGPAPTPIFQGDDMPYVGLKKRADGHTFDAWLVDGGVTTRNFAGDQTPWGPFGLSIPADALAFLNDRPGSKAVEYVGLEWALIEQRTKVSLVDPNVDDGDGGGSSGPSDAQKQAVQATVDAMHSAGTTLTNAADALAGSFG